MSWWELFACRCICKSHSVGVAENKRMKFKVLNQLNVRDKRVFLRTDFNVPISNRRILDDSKIMAHCATINYLMDKGARIVLGTHIGRPKLNEVGFRKDTDYKSLNTNAQIIFKSLKKIYGDKISFINSCIGEDVKTCIGNLREGHILLLQNLRYERGERINNESEKLEFARVLSSYFDIYANDALSVCQNKDASVFYLPQFVKKAAIGFLLKKEKNLMEKLIRPILPAAAFLGGFKVQDKIGALQKLLRKGFEIFLGGAMRNPFLRGC
ncbi:MAG: phosphoglycerate kinase [Candidatus Scalindua rubra]|uniref:Phosphoglycerate kinase n=1 Tax=Candidatus Scalindua rubra TaxID=1872076 RepID=A0A1E3XCN8_9BACT|nr:MAG: phosphoglycerate kinase [Candidatus Scalindua rubra]